MNALTGVDWAKVFLPQASPIEMIVRISIVYLSLVFLFRFVVKREAGGLATIDLLVFVLVADAVQNGMAGSYTSAGDALILALTLASWEFLLSYAA